MMPRSRGHLLLPLLLLASSGLRAEDGYRLWLKYEPVAGAGRLSEHRQTVSSLLVAGASDTSRAVGRELIWGLGGLLDRQIPVARSVSDGALLVGTPSTAPFLARFAPLLSSLGREGYLIRSATVSGFRTTVIVAPQEIGLLYGAFHLLRLIQTGQSLQGLDVRSAPRIEYRLLNHWDNLDGTVERGYAGNSLWQWDELPGTVASRYEDYARANASIGINGAVLNNVNADPRLLHTAYLRKVAKLADVLRPYGIRTFLSVTFSSPLSARFSVHGNRRGGIGDLETADPMDPAVARWWRAKAAEIYRLIPDFGGFLVKADSEGMPGPGEYNRTHADGANMLADALAPFGGVVMWRAFVYRPETDADRVKRAYREFVPLDGRFRPNVFVQVKNGPLDFQPREPVHPLFGAMPSTPQMLELQISQEYLGHSTHLVYLGTMWREYLQFDTHAGGKGSPLSSVVDGSLQVHRMSGIAGVSNTGSDRNWCGHLFAQANWFAFGRLAWDHRLGAEQIAEEWIRMTFGNRADVVATLRSMMMGSWEAAVNYMTPLGLHHIMEEGVHYGPGPDHDRSSRQDWNSVYYHRADRQGLGFDRSSSGSNAVAQYPRALRELFNRLETCPQKYLLWFHHVAWDHVLRSGRTLWEELCHRYQMGVRYVEGMIRSWESLEGLIDPEVFRHVKEKLAAHRRDAGIWRDRCLSYFQRFSRREIIPLAPDPQ